MEEKDVVKVLQHYRHDLMNHLQMINGYLSMGKMNKVESKVSDSLAFYNEERKLISLNAPKFTLWLIQFNHVYENFRMTYQIHTENKKLHDSDEILVNLSNAIVDELRVTCDNQALFEINLQLEETFDPSYIKVTFFMEGFFCKLDKIKINEKYIGQGTELLVNETSRGKQCSFLIPCNT